MNRLRYLSRQNIIAMVYDFDGTLSPHNMQEDTIFKAYGLQKEKVWRKCDRLVKSGYERTLAYLHLLIQEEPFQKKPLNTQLLKRLACHIQYYPGVKTFFGRINRLIETTPEAGEWGIRVEHYIISSGMIEILRGSSIFHHFKKVYACEYAYHHGSPVFPKLVINDTNKTQFLFRINKGCLELKQDINSHMPEEDRRIPFRNMIYLGDSQTDIPSMTVVQRNGGQAIAVFDPVEKISRRVREMVEQRRVDHFAPADFRKGSLLSKIVNRTLKKIIYNISYLNSARMSMAWVKQHNRK